MPSLQRLQRIPVGMFGRKLQTKIWCLGNGSWLMTLNGQSSVWDISNIVVEEIIKESRRTEFRIVSGK